MRAYELLPTEEKLETRTEEHMDDITRILKQSFDNKGSFVPNGAKEMSPKFTAFVTDIVKALAIDTSEVEREDIESAALSSIAFASALSKIAAVVAGKDRTTYFDFKKYVQDIPSDELVPTMEADADEFLAQHPSLNELVMTFLPQIDQTGKLGEATRTFTAVTLHQIEDHNSNLYMERGFEELMLQANSQAE